MKGKSPKARENAHYHNKFGMGANGSPAPKIGGAKKSGDSRSKSYSKGIKPQKGC